MSNLFIKWNKKNWNLKCRWKEIKRLVNNIFNINEKLESIVINKVEDYFKNQNLNKEINLN